MEGQHSRRGRGQGLGCDASPSCRRWISNSLEARILDVTCFHSCQPAGNEVGPSIYPIHAITNSSNGSSRIEATPCPHHARPLLECAKTIKYTSRHGHQGRIETDQLFSSQAGRKRRQGLSRYFYSGSVPMVSTVRRLIEHRHSGSVILCPTWLYHTCVQCPKPSDICNG